MLFLIIFLFSSCVLDIQNQKTQESEITTTKQTIETEDNNIAKLSENEIQNKIEIFLTKHKELLLNNADFEIKSIKDKNGLYEIIIHIVDLNIETIAYTSHDGEMFFIDGINIKEFNEYIEKSQIIEEEDINNEIIDEENNHVE